MLPGPALEREGVVGPGGAAAPASPHRSCGPAPPCGWGRAARQPAEARGAVRCAATNPAASATGRTEGGREVVLLRGEPVRPLGLRILRDAGPEGPAPAPRR